MAKKDDAKPEDGKPAPPAAGRPDEFVKVFGPEDGRWRAGIRFGPLGTQLCLADLTAEAFAEIEGDELLEVRRVQAERPAA